MGQAQAYLSLVILLIRLESLAFFLVCLEHSPKLAILRYCLVAVSHNLLMVVFKYAVLSLEMC
ncbi:hypothetical protein E4T42_02779 [Aureobasidium subglaciale]|nr:hypothetical protein E4T42_02779 [Aureobasidium subglaciale]